LSASCKWQIQYGRLHRSETFSQNVAGDKTWHFGELLKNNHSLLMLPYGMKLSMYRSTANRLGLAHTMMTVFKLGRRKNLLLIS